MKKFNIYSDGKLISCETEEELKTVDKKKILKKLEKVNINESFTYVDKVSGREWEIERVV